MLAICLACCVFCACSELHSTTAEEVDFTGAELAATKAQTRSLSDRPVAWGPAYFQNVSKQTFVGPQHREEVVSQACSRLVQLEVDAHRQRGSTGSVTHQGV
jgi:hypothetical protein